MLKGKNSNFRILGICCSKIVNEDVKNIVDSICLSAINNGWKVMLFTTFCDLYKDEGISEENLTGEAGIFNLINTDIVDALVILPESILSDDICKSLISIAQGAKIPVITIDHEYKGVSCIKFDYTTTFEDIVRHIVEKHGCRTINIIAGIKGNEFSEERLKCCKRVLTENNIPIDENRIGYGDFWRDPTVREMERFMNSGLPFPEAIICFNDTMAISVCQYLSQHGISVPDDVIVTGFDGIELEQYYHPRLTTGCVNYSAVGDSAMEMIFDLMNGGKIRTGSIPYQMRIGQSCGCVDASSSNPCDKILKLYDRISNATWHEDYMFNFLRYATRAENLHDLAEVMGTHGDSVEWYCVNSDLFDNCRSQARYHELFTQSMILFMARSKSTISSDSVEFPTKEMLPNLEDVLSKHNILFFSSLHFMENVLGYTCATIGLVEEYVYANRRRYISNISQVLENLINKTKLKRANSELAEMHIHDPLTGLLNRRGFYKEFENRDAAKDICIFSIDMDRLKYINDSFGHSEGDTALKAVAAALLSQSSKEGYACSRLGGDEFSVMVAENDFCPEEYVKRVRGYLDGYNQSSGNPYPVGISIGWECCEHGKPVKIDELMRTADFRMYADKRSRKAERED